MTPLSRRTLLIAALAAPGLPAFAQETGAQAEAAPLASLPLANPTLNERVAAAGVPALAYAVVGPEGVRQAEAAGVRRLGSQETVKPDDPWHIGQGTEAFTAALYARLVEGGRARWGAKLSTLFPEVKLQAAWDGVRIEDLLAHRSGLSDRAVLTVERVRALRQDARPVELQRADLAAELLGRPPPGQPDAFEEASLNYVLAGAAIERITRISWEAAITTGLFRPLGLDSAAFGPPQGEAPWGHELGPDRRLVAVDPSSLADRPPVFGPAERIHLSVGDYGRFCRVFLADGAGLLTPDSLARLARPWGGAPAGMGLGWETAEHPWADGPVLSREGSNGFWRTSALIAPAKGLAVIAACNAEAGGGAKAVRDLSLALVELYTGAGPPKKPPRRKLLPF